MKKLYPSLYLPYSVEVDMSQEYLQGKSLVQDVNLLVYSLWYRSLLHWFFSCLQRNHALHHLFLLLLNSLSSRDPITLIEQVITQVMPTDEERNTLFSLLCIFSCIFICLILISS